MEGQNLTGDDTDRGYNLRSQGPATLGVEALDSSEGIQITAQKGACNSKTMNFSLVRHADNLYIVKSGGFLPYELPGIYEVIPGSQTAIQETTLHGKDIFVVHNMGGFILQSNLDDCRIFTGSMLPDVECAV